MKLAFTPSLILTSIVSLALHYFIFAQIGIEWNVWIWFLYLYFPGLSWIIYSMLNRQIDGRPQTFVTVFMGAMAAKLFVSLILLLMVIYFNPSIKIPFAISFMFLYLIFTTLNTIFIFGKLRGK